MTARPAATQEPGRTTRRHADASLAQAATTAQAQEHRSWQAKPQQSRQMKAAHAHVAVGRTGT